MGFDSDQNKYGSKQSNANLSNNNPNGTVSHNIPGIMRKHLLVKTLIVVGCIIIIAAILD
jgi:hypothetical protein